MSTKLVLLGTGTPNACPNASGPACAVVVDDRAYLVDFGPGVVRQASKAYYKGIDPLQAYAVDIDFRLHGFERANEVGYQVQVQEIQEGIIYRDERVQVEAFAVSHGTLESYGYRFVTQDGVIVVSGDTAPLPVVAEKAKGCDILLHEVEYAAGIRCREEKWQKYHREVHTLSTDLAVIAAQAQPKLLVTTHRIYHMNIQDNTRDLQAQMDVRCAAILEEIRQAGYDGKVVNGQDLDVFPV